MAETTYDIVDLITAKLNELDGIEFARDAWEDKAPDQYGVVEMNEEPVQSYADGHLTDEIYRLTVTMYVNGSGNHWAADVREKMEALEETYGWMDIGLQLTDHEYLYDINKVRWGFRIFVAGPLVRTVSG